MSETQVETLEDGSFIVRLEHALEDPRAVDPEKVRIPKVVRARHLRLASAGVHEGDQGFLLACALTGLDEETLGRLHVDDYTVVMNKVAEVAEGKA